MATLQDLQNAILADENTEQGFVQTFGETQDKFLRNFNTGIARLFGLPNAVADLVGKVIPRSPIADFREQITGEVEAGGPANIFPETRAIQDFAAEQGLTFPFGEEPQDTLSRIIQNIGTTAPILPFTGPVGLAAELFAATGGAVGGKALEETDFGKRNPDLARGIGELGGGLVSGVGVGAGINALKAFFSRGGTLGTLGRTARELLPSAEVRAGRRVRAIEPTPEEAAAGIRAAAETPEGQLLTPAQAAGTPGVGGLSQAVEAADPQTAAIFAKQRIDARDTLKSRFQASGDIADARNFLDSNLAKRAEEANRILQKVETSSDPAALSTAAKNQIELAYSESRTAERSLWNSLPESEKISAPNLLAVHEDELRNLTEGADPATISAFSKGKLGSLKTVKDDAGKVVRDLEGNPVTELSGGVLLNKKKTSTTPKAIHQFYSALGEKMAKLARQGGNANRIRIMREMREAALADLDEAGLAVQYTDAIDFSRDLNNKFTRGPVGNVLGLTRGEVPLSRNSLSEIIGTGGETARQGVEQALNAAPETKAGIEDFLKTQFLSVAQDPNNKKINAKIGNKFINDFEDVLDDFFPGLKSSLQETITSQRSVDEFLGVPQVEDLSPLAKQRSAASFFLGSDPGEEMARLINDKSIQRTNFLRDLVKTTKEDPTGKAFQGLQNGFTREILNHGNTAENIGGAEMLKRIGELEGVMLRTGLFDQPEINRLKSIADTLKKIDAEEALGPAKGGIISDIPSKIISNALRIIGVRLASKINIGGRGFGESLQIANIASGTAQDFANRLTTDGAKALLVKAVRDPKIMQDLLTDFPKSSNSKLRGVFTRLTDEGKALLPGQAEIPTAAIVPGVVSAVTDTGPTAEDQELNQSIWDLRTN